MPTINKSPPKATKEKHPVGEIITLPDGTRVEYVIRPSDGKKVRRTYKPKKVAAGVASQMEVFERNNVQVRDEKAEPIIKEPEKEPKKPVQVEEEQVEQVVEEEAAPPVVPVPVPAVETKPFVPLQINFDPEPLEDKEEQQRVNEEVARRLIERKKELERKHLERERRRASLEEKLNSNAAVAFGKKLLATNDAYGGEHGDRFKKGLKKQQESNERLNQEKAKIHEEFGRMKDRSDRLNATTEVTAKEIAEKKAAQEAEKERLRLEKIAKKEADERKRQEYEARKAARAAAAAAQK